MTSDSQSDLNWLAFRYISGEMEADEAAGFEDRLANDQQAREAVAAAVALVEAVALAGSASSGVLPLRASSRRPLVWLAVAAAAACLAIVAIPIVRSRSGHEPRSSSAREADVALAWSGLRQSGENEATGPTDLVAWLDEPSASGASSGTIVDVGSDDDALPPWLIEAATLRGKSGPGVPEIREN